jgi:hypothetical protein
MNEAFESFFQATHSDAGKTVEATRIGTR